MVYVKLPHLRDTERCWLLKKCMNGTIPAAAGWQHLVQKVGTDIDLLSSSNSPCAFGHSNRDLDMVMYGNDFIVAGDGDDLDWLFQKLNEKLEWKKATSVIGYDTGSSKRERRNQTRGDEVLLAAAEGEKPGAQDREDPRHSQSRRLDDETSGWKTFGNVVRAVEHRTH